MAVFGSAQTANLIEMVGDILGRNLTDAFLRLGALLLYVAAMVIFAVLRKKTPLNLKYLAIAIDAAAAAASAAMPRADGSGPCAVPGVFRDVLPVVRV